MRAVAILAGGLATRMRPLTEKIPKALLDVAGTPFIDRQLRDLHAKGITDVVLCVGFLGDMLQLHVADGSRYGLKVHYSFDGDTLLGTGGALRLAAQRFASVLGDGFFVLYGDSFLPIDFAQVQRAFDQGDAPALMTVLANGDQWDTSNVIWQNGQLRRYSKRERSAEMRHIDYGLGLVRTSLLHLETAPVFDLAALYERLSGSGQLSGFEVFTRFYEIGSQQGLADTTHYFSTREQTMSYAKQHLAEATQIIAQMDTGPIEQIAQLLADVKQAEGRVFFLGVGGSAGNCSHAVNDFRKIVGIECYAPTDNVSELTARTNDEGWATVFVEWLKISHLRPQDALFIFSVGGGNLEKNISPNLVEALKYGKEIGCKIVGVVGRDGGYAAKVADACVIVPTVNADTITPHSEAFQAVVWHLLVSHPLLKAKQTKWESAVLPK